MVTVDIHQGLTFRLDLPHAERVEVVGAFDGWHETAVAMYRGADGVWTAAVDAEPGTYLFRYRVDGESWLLDDDDHGRAVAADGVVKSRAYRPPRALDPDHLAA